MNKKQKIILWIGIALFVLVGLNPHYPRQVSRIVRKGAPAPVRKTKLSWGPKDPGRLFCYWTMIAVVTGGLLVTLKDKKDKEPKDEQKQ